MPENIKKQHLVALSQTVRFSNFIQRTSKMWLLGPSLVKQNYLAVNGYNPSPPSTGNKPLSCFLLVSKMLKTYELKYRKLLSGLAAESLSSDITDVCHNFEVCDETIWTDFCSAKRSDLDLFLPKVRYVRKKVRVCVGKERGAFGKNAGPLESAFACVSW